MRPDLSAVPTMRGGTFAKWFNDLTPEELDKVWSNPELREQVEARLRSPGGLHEWNMVSRSPTFKRWGVSAEQIAEMRTPIPDVKFQNPPGWHGGLGSTAAHNEILDLIDSSKDFATFKQKLQTWANTRLVGGANALPPGLRPNGG